MLRTRPALPFTLLPLAAAVILASGCAATGPDDEAGFSGPLVDAGRATAGLTSRAVQRTGYLLGLSDDAGRTASGHPMDEVDLAMLEEDAVMPDADVGVLAVERLPADDGLAVARFVAPDGAAGEEVVVRGASTESALTPGATPGAAPGAAPEPAASSIVALDDYTHTVGENETLWEIAKATTGDALNWHALADVNDLGQSASVYPGQDLSIPTDMLRPELADAIVARAAELDPVPSSEPALAAADPTDPPAVDPAAIDDSLAANDLATDGDALGAETLPDPLADASPIAPAPESPAFDARGFTVRPGESLWEFSRRATGNATYWQAIAAHNGFDEQRARTIRTGEEIFVPEVLVRAELGGTEAPRPEQGAIELDRAPADSPRISPRMVPIAAASDALPAEPAPSAAEDLASTDGEALEGEVAIAADAVAAITAPAPAPAIDETRDMTIVEASFSEPVAEEFSPPEADAPDEIIISGTYYPKAVYNRADFSSSLLMRVSPGTTLRVAGVEGPWYAVETEGGTGYVHDRDTK